MQGCQYLFGRLRVPERKRVRQFDCRRLFREEDNRVGGGTGHAVIRTVVQMNRYELIVESLMNYGRRVDSEADIKHTPYHRIPAGGFASAVALVGFFTACAPSRDLLKTPFGPLLEWTLAHG